VAIIININYVYNLGEGEFTHDAQRVVVDGDFTVMFNPALSSENVMYT